MVVTTKLDMKVTMPKVEKNNWKDVSGVVTGMENDMIQFKTPKGKEMQASPQRFIYHYRLRIKCSTNANLPKLN